MTEPTITTIESRSSPESDKTDLNNPAGWLGGGLVLDGPAASGVNVTEASAMRVTAVWRCVWLIASTIASLPLNVYERTADGGRVVAAAHPAHDLLHDEPNPDMTAIVFREIVIACALLLGNGYAGIERDGAGNPIALWPIHPSHVRVGRISGVKYYQVTIPGQPADYWADSDILHLPGMGFDGLAGMRALDFLRQSVGLALASEEFGGRYFGNGAPPGVVIEAPNTVSGTALANLKSSWNATHGGVGNAHKTAILEEGMKVSRFGITPNDAQFLDTRKFQLTEIARFFGVPPHLVGDLERATFSNIEQQALDFEKYGLRRWLVATEQECRKKLIRRDDRQRYYVEHNVDGLLRGDIESRYRAYATGRQWGFLNADSICDKENMNRLPDGQGQIYLVPANMMAASAVPTTPPVDPPNPADEENARQMHAKWVDAFDRLGRRERQAVDGAKDDATVQQRLSDHADYVRYVIAPVCHAAGVAPEPIALRYVAERSKDWRAAADPQVLVRKLLENQ